MTETGAEGVAAEQPQSTETGAIKTSLDSTLAAIRESAETDQAKAEAITRAYDQAEQRYEQAIQRAETTAAERVQKAEQDLFKVSSGHGEYRAAYNEAAFAGFGESREVWEAELGRMLERAEKTGDARMADAIFQLAVEQGFDELGEKYLARRPDKQKKVAGLTVALEDQKRVEQETGWARSYPLRRPHEYDSRFSTEERVRPSERISRGYGGG